MLRASDIGEAANYLPGDFRERMAAEVGEGSVTNVQDLLRSTKEHGTSKSLIYYATDVI